MSELEVETRELDDIVLLYPQGFINAHTVRLFEGEIQKALEKTALQDRGELLPPRLYRQRGARGHHGRHRGGPRQRGRHPAFGAERDGGQHLRDPRASTICTRSFPPRWRPCSASGTSRGPARLEGPAGRWRRRRPGRPAGPRAPRPESWPARAFVLVVPEPDGFPGHRSRCPPRRWPRSPASTRRRRTGWPSRSTRPRPTFSSTRTAGPRTGRSRSASTTAEPALSVDVVDNGAKVDLRSVPRVDIERYVSERRTGGLGVHLMEKIMDSVTFRRTARRNVCCLVKRKAGPAGS